jgi:hypothetical protein
MAAPLVGWCFLGPTNNITRFCEYSDARTARS